MSNIWWESEQFIELPGFKDASLGFINSPLAQVNVFTISRDLTRNLSQSWQSLMRIVKYLQRVDDAVMHI